MPVSNDQLFEQIAKLTAAIDAQPKNGERVDSARVLAVLERLEKEVEEHDHILNGNGKEGLRSDVRDLKRSQATISRLAWIIVTAVIGLIVLVAFNVMITYGSTSKPKVDASDMPVMPMP